MSHQKTFVWIVWVSGLASGSPTVNEGEDLLMAPQVVDLVAVLAETAQSPSQSLMEEAELNLPEPCRESKCEWRWQTVKFFHDVYCYHWLLAKIASRFNLKALVFQNFPVGICPQIPHIEGEHAKIFCLATALNWSFRLSCLADLCSWFGFSFYQFHGLTIPTNTQQHLLAAKAR